MFIDIVDNSVTNGATFADMVDELRIVIKGDEQTPPPGSKCLKI